MSSFDDLDEAVQDVDQFFTTGYKSPYLKDAWMYIKQYLEDLKEKKKETT